MKITSNDLEITKISKIKHYSDQQKMNIVHKLVIKLKINFDSFDTNKEKFISYFGDEIVEAKSIQRMREILSEVGYYLILQVEKYLNKNHDATCNHVHQYKFHIY